MAATIAILTDFGWSDPFVGEMKGVIRGLAPDAVTVDLTHGVDPGNVREAAWILSRAWRSFPPDTCFLVVVDPGVGTDRRAVVASAGGRRFVGPDNGVLLPALQAVDAPAELRWIQARDPDHVRRGTTFDGRDVFAPAAARLAAGEDPGSFGPELHDPVPMLPFGPRAQGDAFEAEIIRADRYGNLITVMEEAFLRKTWGDDWRAVRVTAGSARLAGVHLGYGYVPEGEALLTIGGSGTLEIGVNRGSARERLGLRPGETVAVEGPDEEGTPVGPDDGRRSGGPGGEG